MELNIEAELRIAADDQSHCGNVAFEALTRLKRIGELIKDQHACGILRLEAEREIMWLCGTEKALEV